MKKQILILLAILLPLAISAQYDFKEVEKQRVLKLGIKQATQYNYKFNGDTPAKEGYKHSTIIYNKQGLSELEEYYNRDGQISQRMEYKYNDQEQIIEFENFKPGHGFVNKQVIQYDDEYRKKLEQGLEGKTAPYRIVYKYTNDGKNSETIRYDAQNKEDEKWVYSYDGDIVNINVYRKGTLDEKIKRQYDSNGNMILEEKWNSKNENFQKRVYELYPDGRLKTIEEYRFGNFIEKEEYEYDSQKRLVKLYKQKTGKEKILDHTYEYNSKGDLITETWFDRNPDDYSYKKYTYDSKGFLKETESYYASYKYKVLNKFEYEL